MTNVSAVNAVQDGRVMVSEAGTFIKDRGPFREQRLRVSISTL